MPICAICDMPFYRETYSRPAESCDCGTCLTQADVEQMERDHPSRLAYIRQVWNATLNGHTLKPEGLPYADFDELVGPDEPDPDKEY